MESQGFDLFIFPLKLTGVNTGKPENLNISRFSFVFSYVLMLPQHPIMSIVIASITALASGCLLSLVAHFKLHLHLAKKKSRRVSLIK